MKAKHGLAAAIGAVVVSMTACGGGGGGGSGGGGLTGAVTAPPVSISSANSPSVAATATGDVQSVSSVADSTSAVSAVQVVSETGSNKVDTLTTMHANESLAQFALKAAPHVRKPGLISAVSVSNEAVDCDSGNMVVSGSIADNTGYTLSQGDYLDIKTNNCRFGSEVLNGGLYVQVSSGSFSSYYYSNVGLAMKFTALSLATTTNSVVTTTSIDGDASFVMTKTYSGSTMDITGTVLTRNQTINGIGRRTSLKNYSERYVVSGSTATATVTAEVHTTNTNLGAAGGSYALTTPTAVAWNTSTNVIQSGVVQIVGANAAKVRATAGLFSNCSGSCVLIETDANGDGTYESSEIKTWSQFQALY